MIIGMLIFPEMPQLDFTGPYEVFAQLPGCEVKVIARSLEPVTARGGLRFLPAGALVLGAAGLLKGYRATTHWLSLDLLPIFGATAVPDRIVIDRNRITGGGVTAGIDFALAIAGELCGVEAAKTIQLF